MYSSCSRWLRRSLMLLAVCCLSPGAACAQSDSTVVFSDAHPIIYEDAWDLWPYVFLNEDGDPEGYNIDVLKLIFKELSIPYIIRLKPTAEALNDLKAGRSDLMCGMDAHFHNDYARYGQSVIQIFTHSVVHQRQLPAAVTELSDLSRHRVVVHEGSFSHHLMKQKGWGANAISYGDMQEAVQKAHHDPDCQIVWNTMSLKWLIHKYHYDNLELTPVNIPHGQYKFMSNNLQLLHRLDSVYTILNSTGQLQPIQNKWFYPERRETGIPDWIWWLVGILLFVTLMTLVYYAVYWRQEKKMTREIRRSNNRLALVLQTCRVHIWVYNVASKTVSLFDDDGVEQYEELVDTFLLLRMGQQEADRVKASLRQLIAEEKEDDTLEIKARHDGDSPYRYYVLTLTVLRRDRNGQPTNIIGSTNDVTDERERQQKVKNAMLRYQSIFNTVMVDTVTYDAQGYITDMNEKASKAFPGGKEGALANRVNLFDVLGDDMIPLDELESLYLTRIYQSVADQRVFNTSLHQHTMYYELQLIPLRDADHKLTTIFGTGLDVSEMVRSYMRLRHNAELLERANNDMSAYIRNIDFVLQNGGVRMAHYSPTTHTLVIYSEIGRVQYRLTQARCMDFVDDSSKHTARRLLNNMDNLTATSLKEPVKTVVPLKGGHRLQLYFSFIPTLDGEGRVVDYFGMCRDISDIKATEEELARETVKAQEIETLKNSFLRNMSYEIRVPLNSVVGFAELFSMEHAPEDETFFISEIKGNSSRLLRLINDILFLSRLDARMIEFKMAPVDFAAYFEPRCQAAWYQHRHDGVDFMVNSPYSRLVVDIDEQNLGMLIDQIVANAAEYTTEGQVRCRYDYTGEALVMAFQDTGCGISQDRLQQIFERFVSTGGHGTGLGLSICHEIAQQMGGKITIKSEVGKGTIVWVSIPCKCTEIVRS